MGVFSHHTLFSPFLQGLDSARWVWHNKGQYIRSERRVKKSFHPMTRPLSRRSWGIAMDRIRMTDPESPYYRQAMELYAAGFPLHEQRRPEEQIQAMKDPAFHCDALVESGTFIGLLFYWEAVGVTYVEHFAVVEALRSSGAAPVPWPRSVPPTPPWYWRSIRLRTPSPPVGKAFISGWASPKTPMHTAVRPIVRDSRPTRWSSCPGPRPFRQRLTAPFPVCSLTESCGMPRWESASLQ